MRKILIILTTLAALSGAGCGYFPGVYKIDIAQGNFVTRDMLGQLQPGMTEEQVRYVLGVPTLKDPFTPNVWYYLMSYRPGNQEPITQEIVVYFNGSSYSHYEGQVADSMRDLTGGNPDRELEKRADDRKKDGDALSEG